MTEFEKLRQTANGWINAWNSGNLELLLDHYAEDVIFYSSAATRRWNTADGKITGKKALENHFRKAFEEVPGMKLTFKNLLLGAGSAVLLYQRETGDMAADVVLFDGDGKVKEVRVFNESHEQ
jgi:ketosteroid isomerase-like protein